MASVYLAVHRGTGGARVAALKVVRATMAEDGDYQEMFVSESELALRLNHPNVIHAYEAGGEGASRYLAMEFLSGHSFEAVLRRTRATFPLELHVHVLCEVLRGLHYVHCLADYDGQCLGLVHRDVNPSNVFITYDGNVKLVDFGIAKNHRAATETTAGVVKGKAGYMAPEQAAMGAVDGRTDVFAVGVLLWEALTRTRLVEPKADSNASLLRRVSGLEPKVTALSPDADPTLIAICDRAMEIVPIARYASALEMLEDLEQWAATRTSSVGPRSLAALTTTAFSAEKARVESKIRDVMTGVRPGGTSLPKLALDARGTTEDPTPLETVQTEPRERARSPGRGIVLVAGAAFVLAAAVLASARFRPVTARAEASLADDRSSAALAAEPASASASASAAAPVASTSPSPEASAPIRPERPAESRSRDRALRVVPPPPPPPPPHPRSSEDEPRKTARPLRPIDKEDPYE